MNTEIININHGQYINCDVQCNLSFRPLVAYLKRRLKSEQTIKREFYRFLLEKIENEEALAKTLDINQLKNHRDTLELIYTILTPLMANEQELFWALSTPIPAQLFFSTDRFYNFFIENEFGEESRDEAYIKQKERQQLHFVYNLILERLYNFNVFANQEIIYTHESKKNDFLQYYKIIVDTQFVDISYLKTDLPKLNFELFGKGQEEVEIATLLEILPLSDFKFDGFTIISISDITVQHSLDNIKNALADHNYEEDVENHVIHALKTLAAMPNLKFGLLPLITVNNKPVISEKLKVRSVFVNILEQHHIDFGKLYNQLEAYKKDPKPINFTDFTNDQDERNPLIKSMKDQGIETFAFLPVFYNQQLVGLIEMYADTSFTISDQLLARIYTAMPLLGQLFQYKIADFKVKMEEIITDNYTALQPSVQWKFNEQVFEYMNSQNDKDLDTVTFKNLFPLYGAIDIRNSTIERNKALKEDLIVLLNELKKTLVNLNQQIKLELTEKLLYNCDAWISQINSDIDTREEHAINVFLETEIHPVLKHLKKAHPDFATTIDDYFKTNNPKTGIAFQNRRQLEESMQLINAEVSDYLQNAQKNLQKIYPCYFAKFRTDGIEYDIYIGQEIAPEIPFDNLYLKNMRLWQLTAMAEIAKRTENLIHKMNKPLYTTQLIFIHATPIDISFRNDERRFDVEGAYNIRYEIIKKRIDKALIKSTQERLTQAGKIAIVYHSNFEIQEYLAYFKYLQEQNILLNDLENLDIEELQGVSGLKALRIGINYQNN